MKSLMVFISPKKDFTEECKKLVKVQIENHHRLGLPKDDLLLVTNFNYEYLGIKSVLTKTEHFYKPRPRSIKTAIIPALIDEGIIRDGIYWNHDMDAFQLNPMTEQELNMNTLALTDYGWRPRLCLGSYFLKKEAKEIFARAKEIIYKDIEDEDAMAEVLMNKRIQWKRLNITYNFGMRHIEENWERALKPLRVLHFHPDYKLYPTWDIFVEGKNKLGFPLVNKGLKEILVKHYG